MHAWFKRLAWASCLAIEFQTFHAHIELGGCMCSNVIFVGESRILLAKKNQQIPLLEIVLPRFK